MNRLGQARHIVGARLHPDARSHQAVSDRLGASAQALREELLGHGHEGQLVLGPERHDAVPFVAEDEIGHRDVPTLERRDHLVRLRLVHAHVVGAMADQEGRPDRVSAKQR